MYSYNITQFLNHKSSTYYNEVIDIIKEINSLNIEKNKPKIYIFGGFIREIISHYYSSDTEFIPSKDVDLWFDYKPQNDYISLNSWIYRYRQILYNLNNKINITDAYRYNVFDDISKYGLLKLKFNNIDFDISTCINTCSLFDTLSDYTVNNLYIDIDGNINTRINSIYSVSDILLHIKKKELYKISTLNDENIKNRTKKMLDYGYVCVDNL